MNVIRSISVNSIRLIFPRHLWIICIASVFTFALIGCTPASGTPSAARVTPSATLRSTATRTATPTLTPIPPTAVLTGVEHGAQIFSKGEDQSPPCSSCHLVSVNQSGFSLGPNLAGISERAAERMDGVSAEVYLHESIVEPQHYVVPGYRDMMYRDYESHLDEQDIDDLIAYLLTL